MKKILLLLLLPVALTAELPPLPLQTEGICHDFTLKLDVRNSYWDFLADGCMDIKIDAPGKIMTNGEWQDTFFYANNAMCNGTAELNISFQSSSNIASVMKFRQGNKIQQATVAVAQNCPKPISGTEFLGFVSSIILLMLVSVWWYRR